MPVNRSFILTAWAVVLILVAFGCIKWQFGPGQQRAPQKEMLEKMAFYTDSRVVIYREDGKTRLVHRETGRVIESGYSHTVERIRNKPPNAVPLVGVAVQEGLRLVGNDEICIIEVQPRFRRLSVYPNPGTGGDKIIILKDRNAMFFYKQGDLYKVYPVATGKNPAYTPEGSFRIVNKVEDEDDALKVQLGPCWMGLGIPCEKDKRAHFDERAPSGKKYGIHGTNEPESIGRHASGGCIRMFNQHAVELYGLVEVGTPVEIR